jgi:hypothetical protein
VVQAVADGQFHIYPVRTIDEGIAILTGRPAGARGPDGKFSTGTVNRLVDDALASLALRLKNFGKPPAKKDEKEAGLARESEEENGEDKPEGEPEPPGEPGFPGDEPELPGDEPELPGDEPELPGDEPEPPGDEPEPPAEELF